MKIRNIAIGVAALFIAPFSVARDKIEIKSGANGSTYCVPMDDPRCKSHFAAEAQRLNERRELDRRYEDLERRDRERQREYEWRRDSERERR